MKKRAMSALVSARQRMINIKKAEAEERLTAAFALPDVKSAHTEYVKANFAYGMSGKGQQQVDKAHAKYIAALAAHGYAESDFYFVPSCPICGDTGVVNGRLCNCAASEYVACLKHECGLDGRELSHFEDLNTEGIKNPAQRADMQKIVSWLKAYSAKLPNVKYKTLVLLGGTGTGKTTLAGALALAAVERGESALVFSAYKLNNLFLECHTSPIAERDRILDPVMHADLVVIDDLGTEPMLRNVTLEYLLVLLEERLRAGLCTVITSNLSMSALRDRYQERVCSRLSERETSHIFVLRGDDLRL